MKSVLFSSRALAVAIAAVAYVAVAGVASASTVVLQTPAGLNPGDHFRFVFVTDGQVYGNTGTIDATSSDIATYNSFVNAQAGGATYGGSTVIWSAIGSTTTVNARDNVGGFETLVPVYLVDGTRAANDLTTNTDGFWSGSLLSGVSIGVSIDGTAVSSYAWTGSNNDGTAYGGYELGSGGYAYYGDSDATGGFLEYDNMDGTYTAPMFAMSSELTVGGAAVPEIDPAGIGSVLALVAGALGLAERRRPKLV